MKFIVCNLLLPQNFLGSIFLELNFFCIFSLFVFVDNNDLNDSITLKFWSYLCKTYAVLIQFDWKFVRQTKKSEKYFEYVVTASSFSAFLFFLPLPPTQSVTSKTWCIMETLPISK